MLPDRMDQGRLLYSTVADNAEQSQGLLAVPFVLHSQPTAIYQEHSEGLKTVAADTHQRYAEIMRDVENLIEDHSRLRSSGNAQFCGSPHCLRQSTIVNGMPLASPN